MITNDAPDPFLLGDTVVTFTASDDNGNGATAIATVTVSDTASPVLTMPDSITVEGDTTGGAGKSNAAIEDFLNGATATDIVDPAPVITNDAPELFPLGDTVVTFTAIDASGNQATTTAGVTIVDTTPPYTSGHDPAPGATGVPLDTDVAVHVRDDVAGVDQASIALTVDGVDVTSQSVISGGPDDYTVTYDPLGSFDFGREVNVTIDATDLASPRKAMPTETYSFLTAAALGAIGGNVFIQGGTDHSGVTVGANGTGATTASDGSYSIEGLPPGSYTLTATKDKYLTATKGDVVVEPGGTTAVDDVTLLAGDLNADGVIDLRDLVILAQNLGLPESPW